MRATVLRHARRYLRRHLDRGGRSAGLGRGPCLQRAARFHDCRPARCRGAGVARPRAGRAAVERPAVAASPRDSQPGTFGGKKGRRRPRPGHRRRRVGRHQPAPTQLYGRVELLRRTRPERLVAARPGHDRPGRRQRAARDGGAAVRCPRGGPGAGRRGPWGLLAGRPDRDFARPDRVARHAAPRGRPSTPGRPRSGRRQRTARRSPRTRGGCRRPASPPHGRPSGLGQDDAGRASARAPAPAHARRVAHRDPGPFRRRMRVVRWRARQPTSLPGPAPSGVDRGPGRRGQLVAASGRDLISHSQSSQMFLETLSLQFDGLSPSRSNG
jgi:hypothetical protein